MQAAALVGLAGVLQGPGAAAAVRSGVGSVWRRPEGLLKAVLALQVTSIQMDIGLVGFPYVSSCGACVGIGGL